MRATSAVPVLSINRTLVQIGVATSLAIPAGRMVAWAGGNQNNLQVYLNDYSGAPQTGNTGDGTAWSETSDKFMGPINLPGDGTNQILKNSAGVISDVCYVWWTFA